MNSAKQHTNHKRTHLECFQERSPLFQQDLHWAGWPWPPPARLERLPPVQGGSLGRCELCWGRGEAGRHPQSELGDASLLTLHPDAPPGSRGHRASPWTHSRLPSPLLHVGGSEGLYQGHLRVRPLWGLQLPAGGGVTSPESHLRSRQRVSWHKGRRAPRYNFPFSSRWWRCL